MGKRIVVYTSDETVNMVVMTMRRNLKKFFLAIKELI